MNSVVVLAHGAAEDAGEGRLPPLGWGIGAFVILMLALIVVWTFGKGRPHA